MPKKNNKQIADFDNITGKDLASDERMRLLYAEAVRRKFWDNDADRVLEFYCLAEKALEDDKHGTPGKLFYALIKKKDFRFVTDKQERRAADRMPSGKRHQIVDDTADMLSQPRSLFNKEEAEAAFFGDIIGFNHAILAQCFFPQKEQPLTKRKWEMAHGRAKLMVKAGEVVDPDNPQNPDIDLPLPSGAKARLILPYIIGYSIQHKTRTIDLGSSLRDFMKNIRVPISGQNGRAFTREVLAVANAEIKMTGWEDEHVSQKKAPISDEIDFWLERRDDQQTFWRPEMTISPQFYDLISSRRVPVNMTHLVGLQRSPRRMDIYTWLTYRLPLIKGRKPVLIPLASLKDIFGRDLTDMKAFKLRFTKDLAAIKKIHADFSVDVQGDMLIALKSRSPIPESLMRA